VAEGDIHSASRIPLGQVAVDFGKQGVRVNAIAPGPVLTAGLRQWLEARADVRDLYGDHIPLGRAAEPREIA
jgi:meso-butanediol dehydrogenase / (S,S)-butanediol dehydrogenase / diacetyl reductase